MREAMNGNDQDFKELISKVNSALGIPTNPNRNKEITLIKIEYFKINMKEK